MSLVSINHHNNRTYNIATLLPYCDNDMMLIMMSHVSWKHPQPPPQPSLENPWPSPLQPWLETCTLIPWNFEYVKLLHYYWPKQHKHVHIINWICSSVYIINIHNTIIWFVFLKWTNPNNGNVHMYIILHVQYHNIPMQQMISNRCYSGH